MHIPESIDLCMFGHRITNLSRRKRDRHRWLSRLFSSLYGYICIFIYLFETGPRSVAQTDPNRLTYFPSLSLKNEQSSPNTVWFVLAASFGTKHSHPWKTSDRLAAQQVNHVPTRSIKQTQADSYLISSYSQGVCTMSPTRPRAEHARYVTSQMTRSWRMSCTSCTCSEI